MRNLSFLLLISLLLTLSITKRYSIHDHLQLGEPSEGWKESTFENQVDHSHKEWGTFGQRYWVNDEWWDEKNNGPIFLYICGEGRCNARGNSFDV